MLATVALAALGYRMQYVKSAEQNEALQAESSKAESNA
jgi:hypothetical protein